MKILTIIGARPQFIKAGTLSRSISQHKDIEEVIIHTGQHYDANMSDVFFEEMKIPKPNYYLGVGGKSHASMTGQMMEKIEGVALLEKPDWILVYGDTNSTLAGALVASKLHIKLAHVEAGLRSFNMKMPEEINRILTDRVSDILFCPTQTAVDNLREEGYKNINTNIVNCGDIMYEGAMFYKDFSTKPENFSLDKFILATIHRAENTDDKNRLKDIIDSLNVINKKTPVVLPLHPRTKNKLNEYEITPEFTIIKPVGYLDMIWLINNSTLIMTDSGGLQKEAYFFKKPCITLREETEWVELINNKFNILTGSSKEKILSAYQNQLFNKNYEINLYGQGNTSAIILNNLRINNLKTD